VSSSLARQVRTPMYYHLIPDVRFVVILAAVATCTLVIYKLCLPAYVRSTVTAYMYVHIYSTVRAE
jgi:hypothetical protein